MEGLVSVNEVFAKMDTQKLYEEYCKRLEFKNRAFKAKSKLELLPIGREYYQWAYDDMMEERSKGFSYYPYVLPFADFFTPIESDVWGWIRYAAIPMLPEYPAGKYYIDFADPYFKVGIECDGKAWHDPVKDAARDTELRKLGWQIYRLTGTEITRSIPQELETEVEDAWNDEYDAVEKYGRFKDFRIDYLDKKLDYSNKYASAKLERIFKRHFGKDVILY